MYALVGMSIVMVYKSSGVVNLAQGALVMLAAYLAWAFARHAGMPVVLAAGLAAVAMCGAGALIAWGALRRMVGQPPIMALMLTLGLDILLRGLAPALWGPDTKPLDLGFGQAPLAVLGLLVNGTYLIGGVAALAVLGLLALFFRTRIGIMLRAASDDHLAAWSVGVSVERAMALSWAIAGAIGAVAGVLWASVQGVEWSLSLLLIKGLAVAVLGGLDSTGGAVLGGLVLGVLENVVSGFADAYVGGGTKEVVASLVILATILARPHGFFGREVIERV
ncbi:MAG: branched-chain amino acid ABC transporter permease [Limnochordaceae bacterium]|nr:branched-chain amino acid ABC transporter permease [Limnochordaceae bacterium]